MKPFLANLWEVIQVVAVAGVIVFFVRVYVAQPFLVSGASMEPTFSSGNYLLVDEISYRFRQPQRGEVLVFRYPRDENVFYIKRLIGLPQEHVVVKNGQVAVNGKKINENYLPPDVRTLADIDRQLGPDEFFVLGDNRYYSYDSRQWGILPRKDIIGLVRVRLFPIQEVQAFHAPAY